MDGQLILFIICLFVSGFFSGSEAAVLSASRVRIKLMADRGSHAAEMLDRLLDNPSRLLATILIGNNVANVATASLATVLATQWLGGSGLSDAAIILITTLVTTVFLLVVGEITPKGVAVTFPESLSLVAARPLRGLQLLLAPVISAFTLLNVAIERVLRVDKGNRPHVSPEEFRHMALMLEQAGELHEAQGSMLSNVIKLSSTTASDVMVPRTEIAFMPSNASPQEVFDLVRAKRRSRYPVYDAERGIDEIIGLLHVMDLIDWPQAEVDTLDVVALASRRSPMFVTGFMQVGKLFRDLQRHRHQLAIVVDEYGGVAGLVTIEDIVEEIVGEILDEFEPLPIRQLNERTWLVQGTVRLDELEDAAGIVIDHAEDVDTLGGYIFTRHGRVPEEGQRLHTDTATLTVRKLEGRRIRSVIVSRRSSRSTRTAGVGVAAGTSASNVDLPVVSGTDLNLPNLDTDDVSDRAPTPRARPDDPA